ncbi:hypothetical protein EVAR_93993_1 [Eumeta japonica]|uniref:Uncharacterized protein n=1 Tax=Eumeta variegata TaxID=151549 RepID=A0A4C1TPD0_EUMVA|nr:hypothetical protein EVAR_93993_1 [Eumeta japonica]
MRLSANIHNLLFLNNFTKETIVNKVAVSEKNISKRKCVVDRNTALVVNNTIPAPKPIYITLALRGSHLLFSVIRPHAGGAAAVYSKSAPGAPVRARLTTHRTTNGYFNDYGFFGKDVLKNKEITNICGNRHDRLLTV